MFSYMRMWCIRHCRVADGFQAAVLDTKSDHSKFKAKMPCYVQINVKTSLDVHKLTKNTKVLCTR